MKIETSKTTYLGLGIFWDRFFKTIIIHFITKKIVIHYERNRKP